MVQSVSVVVPELLQAAAAAGGIAGDGAVDERHRAHCCTDRRRPPRPSCRDGAVGQREPCRRCTSRRRCRRWPPVMVRPEIDAVTPASTWNTRLGSPPLIVTPAGRAGDRGRRRSFAQLELAAGQGDRLRGGEDGRVEGDRRSPAGLIGQVDGAGRVERRRRRCRAVAGRVDSTSERLRLEGADVDRAASAKPRWSVVTPLTAVPASMAGLPGKRAWSGSARRCRPAGPGRGRRRQTWLPLTPSSGRPSRRCRSGCRRP